jgi:hypothetical protein
MCERIQVSHGSKIYLHIKIQTHINKNVYRKFCFFTITGGGRSRSLGLSNRQNKGRSKSKSNNSYSNPGNTSHFSSSSSFDFSLCNLSKISAVMKSRRREKKKITRSLCLFQDKDATIE